MRRTAGLATLALLLIAPAASALPEDAPVVTLDPANGTLVQPGEQVALRFTCPPYQGFVSVPPRYYGPEDYFVRISTVPNTVPTGTLDGSVDFMRVGTYGDGTCGGERPFEEVEPGTYYWQPYRICIDCTADNFGPVYAITVVEPPPPPPTLSGTDARSATRSFVMQHTRRTAQNIKIRCSRQTSVKYACHVSWTTPRYAWSGDMTVWLADDGWIYGSFKGYRASFGCVRRHNAITPCLRRVRWN
jgi:hypothetical protein